MKTPKKAREKFPLSRLVLLIVILGLSQITISQSLLNDIDIQNKTIVQPELDLLYSACDNELVLTVPDNVEDYVLDAESGIPFMIEPGHFVINPVPGSLVDTIQVYKGDELVFEKAYKIELYPGVTISFGNNAETYVTKDEVINSDTISVVSKGLAILDMELGNFTLEISKEGEESVYFEKHEGQTLTEEHKDAIKELNPGDKIIFHRTFILNHKGMNLLMKPITFIIK